MRKNFIAEEWSALLQAPMQAIMGICLADRVDPILFLQEVKSGVAIVAETIQPSDAVGDTMSAALGLAA